MAGRHAKYFKDPYRETYESYSERGRATLDAVNWSKHEPGEPCEMECLPPNPGGKLVYAGIKRVVSHGETAWCAIRVGDVYMAHLAGEAEETWVEQVPLEILALEPLAEEPVPEPKKPFVAPGPVFMMGLGDIPRGMTFSQAVAAAIAGNAPDFVKVIEQKPEAKDGVL